MHQRSPRPIAVTVATILFATGLIGGMLAAYALSDAFTVQNVSINFFITLPLLFIIYRVSSRDNVARWLMTFISGVMLTFMISDSFTSARMTPQTRAPYERPADKYIALPVGCMYFVGVVLLYIPRSNKWFRTNADLA